MFPKVCSAGYSQVDSEGAPAEWQFCGGVLRKRDTCDFRGSSSCHHHREDSYRCCYWNRAGWGGGGGAGIPKQQYQSHILRLHGLFLALVPAVLHPMAAFPLLFPTVVFVINIFSLGGIGPQIDKHDLDYCKCESRSNLIYIFCFLSLKRISQGMTQAITSCEWKGAKIFAKFTSLVLCVFIRCARTPNDCILWFLVSIFTVIMDNQEEGAGHWKPSPHFVLWCRRLSEFLNCLPHEEQLTGAV